MALSVVHFRMHHGNAEDQITFSGNGIKLLDLKREILEKKQISGSLDFDLKIVDESGKVYTEDDEVVPKNASLVARKMPVINSSTSLIARLKNRGYMKASGMQQPIIHKTGEIVMPMKIDTEETENINSTISASKSTLISLSDTVVPTSSTVTEEEEDIMKLLEEETVLKRTIPVNAVPWNPTTGTGIAPGSKPGTQSGIVHKIDSNISAYSSSYKCPRCGKAGHKEKFCPTIGDPAFDPYIGLANVPKAGRKKVSSLEGIDISQNTVIEHKDGTYELFESSAISRDMLKRDADTHLNINIDLSMVPSNLKCALSNTLLKDAVSLPCCNKIVSDSVIRVELIRTSLICPFCQTSGISPDSLIICKDIRNAVDIYIQNYGKIPSVSTEKISVPAPPSHPPQIVQAKPPPPPTTERPVVTAVNTLISPTDFNALSLNTNQMPTTFASHHPMHLGMMMGQPMMFPPTGGILTNPLDEIPPLEALPLPLSIEEFLYEQQLQIEIMKERGFYYRGGYQGRGRGGYQGRGGYFGRGGYQGRSDYGRGRGRGRWNQYRDDYERGDRYNYSEPRDNEEIQDKSERSDTNEKSDARDRYKSYEDDNRRERRYEGDSRYEKYSSRNRSPDRKSTIEKHSYHEYDRHHTTERNYRERSNSKDRIKSRVSDREQYIDRNDNDRNYKQRRDRSISKDRLKSSHSDRDNRRIATRNEIENMRENNREEIDHDKYTSKRKREELVDLDEKPKLSRSHKEEYSSDYNRHKDREKIDKDRVKDDYYKDRERDSYQKDREKERSHREKHNYDKHRDKDREKDREKEKDRDREKDHYPKDREKDRTYKDREKDSYDKRDKDRNHNNREIEAYEKDREKDFSYKEKERSVKDKERSHKDRDEKEKITENNKSDRDIKGNHRSSKSNYDEEPVIDDSIKYQDSQHKITIIPPLKSSRGNTTSSAILSSQSQTQSNNNSKSKRIIIVNETTDNKRRK